MKTRLVLSLMASLLTATQILLILLRGDGMCFNEGCKIVDSMTSVPPFFINLAGLLYFQCIFLGLLLEKRYPGWPLKTVRVLALAGMASEGVLVSFQYFISETFCSYCLIVALFILLLNISFGLKQITSGLVIFAVVVLAFASLQFKTPGVNENKSLERGIYGLRPADRAGTELSLFFSSTCRHCENIIELLKTRKSCAVRFQPIDEIYGLDFPGLERAPVYSASVNRNFLKALGIEEIPVLMAKDAGGIRILKGEQPIREYLDLNCQVAPSPVSSATSESSPVSGGFQPLQDDACSVSKDCDPPPVKIRPGT